MAVADLSVADIIEAAIRFSSEERVVIATEILKTTIPEASAIADVLEPAKSAADEVPPFAKLFGAWKADESDWDTPVLELIVKSRTISEPPVFE